MFTDKLYFELLVRETPPFYGQVVCVSYDDCQDSLPENILSSSAAVAFLTVTLQP